MKHSFLPGRLFFSSLACTVAMTAVLSIGVPHTARAQWSMQIQMPEVNVLVISNYMGIDRKLKPVSGQNVDIRPPAGTPETEVRLTAVVLGDGIVGISSCNGVIATATTKKFKVKDRRLLTASDFTSSGGIGTETSTETKKCIDDLSDKVSKGVGSAPPGRYILELTLNHAVTGAQLASDSKTITILAASVAELNLHLLSPGNGEQISQPSPTFEFQSQKDGKLFVFEHNTPSQSSEDAIRDLNSPLRCLEASFTSNQTQIVYKYPGNARRLLQPGKKYSWFIQATVSTGGGQSETKRSQLNSFNYVSSDANFTTLQNALLSAPAEISNSYNNAMQTGYVLAFSSSRPIYLKEGDGQDRSIDLNAALSILNRLASGTVKFSATITQ